MVVGTLSFGTMMILPPPGVGGLTEEVAPQIAVVNFLATTLAGLAFAYFRDFTLERDILHAALTQSPDFHYVKNLESAFVATNLQVARHHGRRRSSEMVGLTDFDIDTPDRAKALFEQEQSIMQTGAGVTDREEHIVTPEGQDVWYLTSKVALRNRQGDLVGLAGVTRDITERKRLEKQVADSRDLLSRAMAEMSDGFAMFDQDGYLVFCNEQYRAAFPRSAAARTPGTHMTEIIRAVAPASARTSRPT